MADLLISAATIILSAGAIILKGVAYLFENYVALGLICIAFAGGYSEGRASSFIGLHILGGPALAVFLLHAGWASSTMSYTAFLLQWVAPIIATSIIAYVVGRLVRWRRQET